MFSSGSVSLDAWVSLSTANSFCLYFPPFWKWIWSCVVLGAKTEHLSSLNCAGVNSGSWCAVCSAHWGWDNQPGSWDCALLAGAHTSQSQRREGVASVPGVPPHRSLQTPAFALQAHGCQRAFSSTFLDSLLALQFTLLEVLHIGPATWFIRQSFFTVSGLWVGHFQHCFKIFLYCTFYCSSQKPSRRTLSGVTHVATSILPRILDLFLY